MIPVRILQKPIKNTELEYRKDDLWYKIGDDTPYNGYAIDFHENGKMKSRTSISEGKAVGLIEEWDEKWQYSWSFI